MQGERFEVGRSLVAPPPASTGVQVTLLIIVNLRPATCWCSGPGPLYSVWIEGNSPYQIESF